jgi:hypothetical protein
MVARQRDPFQAFSLLESILRSPVKFLLRSFYVLGTSLCSLPRESLLKITVVCLSDTHSRTPEDLPDGDILIHAGDLTRKGTTPEIQAAIDWLSSFPHRHKIAIAGNHDTYLDPRSRSTLSEVDQTGSLNWRDIHYLQHSSMTITHGDRRLSIYGAPQIPACGGPDYAFQYPPGQDAWSDTIPPDTDILVTHTPPKFHLDLFVSYLGCQWLLKECWRVRPRLHVCGHIHDGAGRQTLFWDEAQKAYEEGMNRPSQGFLSELLDPWLWIDALRLAFYGVIGLLWNRVWGGEQRSTMLVNAALMCPDRKLRSSIQVVEI